MIYLLTKFHMPSYNDSFSIAVKLRANGIFTAAMLLFHITHTHKLYKVPYFSPHFASLHCIK
jgi:hypothetical protein